MALAIMVVTIGLLPIGLGLLSESTSTAIAQMPALVSALQASALKLSALQPGGLG
jgi:hypothetical protein